MINKVYYKDKVFGGNFSYNVLGDNNIGDFIIDFKLREGCVIADGTTDYEKNGIHKNLYTYLNTNLPDLLLAGSDSDHYKIFDLTNRFIRLDKNNAGVLGAAELPNIKGSIYDVARFGDGNAIEFKSEGALRVQTDSSGLYKGADYDISIPSVKFDFDASRSSNIYKDGGKVTPLNVSAIPQFRYKVTVKNVKIICPYRIGDILSTTNPEHPSVSWIGTTWELLDDGEHLENTTDRSKLNTKLDAGLPDIQGSIYTEFYPTGGATAHKEGALKSSIANSSTGWVDGSAGRKCFNDLRIKASDGEWDKDTDNYKTNDNDKVYGKSNTVQVKSRVCYFWRRLS